MPIEQDADTIHSCYTLWFVIPALPMFLVFPFLYAKPGFWQALLAYSLPTLVCFGLLGLVLRRFNMDLL